MSKCDIGGVNVINIDVSREKIPVELTVYHTGHEECRGGHFFGPFIRDHYLIHFIKRGKGTFQREDKIYNIGANQAFIIFPGEKTQYKANQKEPWEYYWIGFQGIESEKLLEKTLFSREKPVVSIKDEEVFEILERIVEIDSNETSGKYKEKGLVYYLMGEMVDENHEKNLEKCDMAEGYVRLGVQHMNRNYGRKITVASLAEHLKIDRSYLSRIFKAYIKVSPKEYLTRVRMERAKELLKTTNFQIGDIAMSVGYKDLFTFSKAFKAYTGANPSDFKNS